MVGNLIMETQFTILSSYSHMIQLDEFQVSSWLIVFLF